MSLYPDSLIHYPQSYSDPSSTTSSPEMSVRPTSPVDSRSKNARAQARHRAKRKAYVENLENTVHQLRAALSSAGTSPDIVGQIQYLEQENARLRSESQSLRAQLGGSVSASPTSASTSMSYGGALPSPSSAYPGDATGLRLPSVADAMNLRSATSSYIQHPGYLTEDTTSAGSRNRYYESSADYRRRVSQPYAVPRRDSAGVSSNGGYDKGYDNDRVTAGAGASRNSQRSYAQQSPVAASSEDPQGYSYSQQLYSDSNSTAAFPPASNTAGAYVFSSSEDVKPYVP